MISSRTALEAAPEGQGRGNRADGRADEDAWPQAVREIKKHRILGFIADKGKIASTQAMVDERLKEPAPRRITWTSSP